ASRFRSAAAVWLFAPARASCLSRLRSAASRSRATATRARASSAACRLCCTLVRSCAKSAMVVSLMRKKLAGVDGHEHRDLEDDVSQVGGAHRGAPRNLGVFEELRVLGIA